MTSTKDSVPVAADDDTPGPPIAIADSEDTSSGGKLKMIVALVKKALGVKDIAAMRLSLPASLLEPVPNLEYWGYLDRPDVFVAINDSVDPFIRMLSVVRFTFTKDIKFVHGKVVKPYNSVLGEHFRSHWDVPPVSYDDNGVIICSVHTTDAEEPASIATTLDPDTDSIKSGRSSKSIGSSLLSKGGKSPSTAATSPQDGPETNVSAQISSLTLDDSSPTPSSEERVRIAYLTEQVSHHPPVSSYYAFAPSRHLEMAGVDQISAKISGTTLRVTPGSFNKGIFINITGGFGEGEKYHITHPTASVNGILRGSFYVSVGESCVITQTGNKSGHNFRAILEYKEDGWLSKPRFLIEGVIHTYTPGDKTHEGWTKVKQVPHSHVCAILEGSWRGGIKWKRVGAGSFPISATSSPAPSIDHLTTAAGTRSALSSRINLNAEEWQPLIDITTLRQVPKLVRPLEEQDVYESRKLWSKVTENLKNKEYSEATREKVNIEQAQRDLAAERKRKGEKFIPRWFEEDIESGEPRLSELGRQAIEAELDTPAAYPLEGLTSVHRENTLMPTTS